MCLSDADRLREEDPFTGQAVRGLPQHVIAHRSRFEFDLNRGADECGLPDARAELGPEGLEVGRARATSWCERSLDLHAAYYRMLGQLLDGVAARTSASC